MDDIFVNENGIRGLATAEEIAEMERMAAEMPTPEPTPEEVLRADVDYLLMLMEG